MRFRPSAHPTGMALASLAAFALLAAGLVRHARPAAGGTGERPLIVYVAAALRPPLEVVAGDYLAQTGRRVELRFGASEEILTRAALADPSEPADLFLPADDSYVRSAERRGLVAQSFPLATMRVVLLLAPGNPRGIAAWPDLALPGVRVAVPGGAAAVGKLARDHLTAAGRWRSVEGNVVDTGTVTEAANAAKVGSVDAAVVWDAVAARYPGQQILAAPELAGIVGRVEVAVLSQSADSGAARDFARHLAGPGLARLREAGFPVVGVP